VSRRRQCRLPGRLNPAFELILSTIRFLFPRTAIARFGISMSHTSSIAAYEPTDRQRRFLRFPAVRARTGLSRSTVWRLERQGSFPQHRRISRNAVAWLEDEITAWIRSKL